jgi:hypothetical protein
LVILKPNIFFLFSFRHRIVCIGEPSVDFFLEQKFVDPLLAQLVYNEPMRAQVRSSLSFNREEVKIIIKRSSLLKSQITDNTLLVCEYGLNEKKRSFSAEDALKCRLHSNSARYLLFQVKPGIKSLVTFFSYFDLES